MNPNEVSAVLSHNNIGAKAEALPKDIHFDLNSLEVLNMAEESHYWAGARRQLIRKIVKRFVQPPLEFLDIGCGNGSLLQDLEKAFPGSHATGVDGYVQALLNCRQRTKTATLILQDLANERWQEFSRTYNVITLLDVLEHLDQPASVLKQARELLKDDGIVIVSVPAHQWLWSARDVFLGHRMRYNKRKLNALLTENGFKVLHTSHLFSYLTLPALLHRKWLPSLFKTTGENIESRELRRVPFLNGILATFGRLETSISLRLSLPIGTSVYCVAMKK